MRAILPWLLMPLLSVPLFAHEKKTAETNAESDVEAAPKVVNDMPWAGLGVAKLDEAMRAHASEVPEGVGFLVKSVAGDGPAKTAGLRRYDILWKLDDQILINEAQLATLLKLRKVGDEVKMSIVRRGRQLELSLVLGKMPERSSVAGISPADLPLVPNGVPGMPQVRVTPHDRTAELTRADGSSAKLFYKDDEAHVTIVDADQKKIYDGPVRERGKFAVPDDWNQSIGAMLRSLYKASNPGWMPRRPRPRTVIPSNQDQH